MAREKSASNSHRWVIAAAIVAMLAVGFAIGRFSMFSTQQVFPGTNSAEAGFSRDMQLHHGQAVQMAMIAYRNSSDPEVRMLAYDIATGQAAQKGQMYEWLVQWGVPQAGGPLMEWMQGSEHGHGAEASEPLSNEELQAAMGMATADELEALEAAPGTEADCLFLTLMIRHHEGAIPMTDAVIDLGTEPQVLSMAQFMRAGQSAEIKGMQADLLRLGCQ